MAKGGLGRGLDSLIVKKDEGIVLDKQSESSNFPIKVDINKVEPNKNQPLLENYCSLIVYQEQYLHLF